MLDALETAARRSGVVSPKRSPQGEVPAVPVDIEHELVSLLPDGKFLGIPHLALCSPGPLPTSSRLPMLRWMTSEALFQRVRDLLVDAIHPHRIVVFGSRARGDDRPDSDLDLLVVADVQGSLGKRTGAVRKYLLSLDVPIDLVVQTPAEYERFRMWQSSVAAIADREGLVLYERAA